VLDADDGVVGFEAEACGTEVLEADPVGAVGLFPGLLEARAAGPTHEEDGPAAVVGVLPEVVELEVEEDFLHELDDLEAHAELLLGEGG